MGNSASYDMNQDTGNVDLVNQNLTEVPFIPLLETDAKHLYLSRNKFASLPEKLEQVMSIDLSKNGLGPSLPISIAKPLSSYRNLHTLILAYNQLKDLTESFKSEKILTFNLSTNRFNKLPANFNKNFPNIKTLYFDCNFLKKFSNFQSEKIVTLTLSLNCIETIDTSTINLPQLTKLNLSKNQINNLPNNLSKSFPILESLDLSDNFISEIPENEANDQSDDEESFVFPQTLQELNLSNNTLEHLSKSLTSLPNLTSLNVSNNKLTEIPEITAPITKLDATQNQITKISKQTLKAIKDLTFSKNQLEKFPIELKMKQTNSIVVDHNNIQEIKLSNLQLKTILPKTITLIDLSFNHIEALPKEIFECLPNLQTFSMSFNKISIIPSEINKCSKLTYLEISSNPIKTLPKIPLSLETITASNCQIESLDGVFCEPSTPNRYYSSAEPLRKKERDEENEENGVSNKLADNLSKSESHFTFSGLKHVDFSENNLESFPNLPNLQIINLSHNRLKKFPTITSQTRILDVSMNEIEKVPEIINSPFLVELNLSYNKITKLPKFQKMSHLQYLEFQGNPITGKLDISEMKVIDMIDASRTNLTSISSKSGISSSTEIITSKKDLKILSKEKVSNKGMIYINQKVEDNKCSIGYTEILGLRDSMEDSLIIREDLHLYAVSDGHGGSNTSRFISSKLVEEFERENGIHQAGKSKNKSKSKGKDKDKSSKSKKEMIYSIFKETEKALKKRNFLDGSTICLCHLYRSTLNRKIITAHLGDARALIVCNNGSFRELTNDHKPYNRDEFERIHKNFGMISQENRVDGVLAISRSLGDNYIDGIIREPEINETDIIDDTDKFLVICCDGVFDVLSNDEVAKIVCNAENAEEAAFKIRNVAFGVRSLDNISVIVVHLMNND